MVLPRRRSRWLSADSGRPVVVVKLEALPSFPLLARADASTFEA